MCLSVALLITVIERLNLTQTRKPKKFISDIFTYHIVKSLCHESTFAALRGFHNFKSIFLSTLASCKIYR
jgi:hypothetical protein